jgi:hypothetical protein
VKELLSLLGKLPVFGPTGTTAGGGSSGWSCGSGGGGEDTAAGGSSSRSHRNGRWNRNTRRSSPYCRSRTTRIVDKGCRMFVREG